MCVWQAAYKVGQVKTKRLTQMADAHRARMNQERRQM